MDADTKVVGLIAVFLWHCQARRLGLYGQRLYANIQQSFSTTTNMDARTQGQVRSAIWKNGWKIKKRKHAKKSSFLNGVGRAALCWQHYSDILQNAPFRTQIFKTFFASGGNRALTPLTKILRTLLLSLPNTANQLQLKCMIIGLWSIWRTYRPTSWTWTYTLYTPWVKKKQDTKLLAITSLLSDFQNFFTSRLGSKFAINTCLNIPPRFKHVATLPCEIRMQKNGIILKYVLQLMMNHKVV